jgi:hypothetical protein
MPRTLVRLPAFFQREEPVKAERQELSSSVLSGEGILLVRLLFHGGQKVEA